MEIRKVLTITEETYSESGIVADRPLRKVAAVAVVKNPYAGVYHKNLSEGIALGAELGKLLGEEAVRALGDHPESYGKAGIVGINGELDHAHMFLTTSFAEELRKAVGGGSCLGNRQQCTNFSAARRDNRKR